MKVCDRHYDMLRGEQRPAWNVGTGTWNEIPGSSQNPGVMGIVKMHHSGCPVETS